MEQGIFGALSGYFDRVGLSSVSSYLQDVGNKQGQSSYDEAPERLQWQEGTAEPEDEPNISNGVDLVPKRTPTKQP